MLLLNGMLCNFNFKWCLGSLKHSNKELLMISVYVCLTYSVTKQKEQTYFGLSRNVRITTFVPLPVEGILMGRPLLSPVSSFV